MRIQNPQAHHSKLWSCECSKDWPWDEKMGFAGFLSRTFLHAATQNPVLSCIPRCLASCVGASPAALEAPGALGPNPARPHAEQSLNSEYSGLQMERNGFQYIFSGALLFYLLRSLYTYIMHICLDVIIYMSTILNLSVHRQERGSFCSSHDRSPKGHPRSRHSDVEKSLTMLAHKKGDSCPSCLLMQLSS